MVTIFVRGDNKIIQETELELLDELGFDDIIWIDMTNPSLKEKKAIENFLHVNLATRQQAEEIESSSRYFESESTIMANSNFLIQDDDEFTYEAVSFIVKEGILVTVKNIELKVFSDTIRKFLLNNKAFPTSFHLMVAILETRIDLDADMVEIIAKEIAKVSKEITLSGNVDEEVLLDINQLQENSMLLRENIIDKQRVLSGILKSERFPNDLYPKVTIMLKDVGSLINHTDFSFERLEYLQNTFLGLINIEQNKIIKIFTVVSVVFMPPTLIASVYGMNFKILPELEWKYGYLFAILFMIASSTGFLLMFKKKKWL
ncbi:magnesium/cobalt transporter CorA [Alistipes sp. ZOR0009]|jgi:magnesium transporter|uniref:magnesium/cobalt transporter CorA n=1 Tax=Alistipes sp. ZOR0009 TaxID=1339253 RepID=UPI0006463A7B|nr:magnesium/cobalt transporter CorA [Alistipes sp. ZOR0009]